MSTVPANTWVPTGNDYIVDGVGARLGIQENFGETFVSGATNGLAIHESDDKVFLYAGAANGGIHLRVYDKKSDSWGNRWSWINKPGSGYEGSQAIGVLSISPNGKYLAVGQGNPSNGRRLAAPSQGIKTGKINNDGSIEWLPVSQTVLTSLKNKNIRSLEWVGNTLVASSWNGELELGESIEITLSADKVTNASIKERGLNLFISKGANHLVASGYGGGTPFELEITESNSTEFKPIIGEELEKLFSEIKDGNLRIARTAVHNQLVANKLIVYLGAFNNGDNGNYISRIYQLSVNANTFEIDSYKMYSVNPDFSNPNFPQGTGFDLGTNQGSNNYFYGNFSLAIDPRDPSGNSIFVGGNHYLSASFMPATFGGGLVELDFSGNNGVIVDRLYGPKVNIDDGIGEIPFSPGQPHADSRTITFYDSTDGPKLIQTDDGGIWQIALDENNVNDGNSSWWESLTTKGLNTLEMNVATWNAANNSIAAAYQDNAASLGYFGDDHATNFWIADGTIALFDDGDNNEEYIGYLGHYDYISDGTLVGLTYNSEGYITSRNSTLFYLQHQPSGSSIPWAENSVELSAQNVYKRISGQSSIFAVPNQSNAYQKGIAFYGFGNIYETVETQGNVPGTQLPLRPLLSSDTETLFIFGECLDYQGDDGSYLNQSLYAGGMRFDLSNTVNRQIFGRQANNSSDGYSLSLLEFSNLTQSDFNTKGSIIDIAHSKTSAGDVVYWIQGGESTNFPFYQGEIEQTLNIRDVSGNVQFISLADYQFPNDEKGYQTLVYVPAKEGRNARLVLGGLNGPYYLELNEQGLPINENPQFIKMTWLGLPAESVPGSYIRSMEYDPIDDLLFAATQGQGGFIFDFDGDLDSRSAGTKLLNLSDIQIPLQYKADLDKRGNEQNAAITIQLNKNLQNQESPTSVEIVLKDAEKWRSVMDFVSPYDFVIKPNIDPGLAFLDILTSQGLEYNGGREVNGDIIMPISFPVNVSIYNLIINQDEASNPTKEIDLQYTVRTTDGLNEETATLRLIPNNINTKRLYNASEGSHFLSSNENEIDTLTGSGWVVEGTIYLVPDEATTDVFRFYIPSENRHFYTALESERDIIIGDQATFSGWEYEGGAFSGHNTNDFPPDAAAVVRYLNQENGNHVYSTSTFEQGLLDQDSNWLNEGIAWYGESIL